MAMFSLFYIDMKPKLFLTILTFVLFIGISNASATTVYETTGWITGSEGQGFTFDFTADQAPYTYQATLTDLSDHDSGFGFDLLFLEISSSTEMLGSTSEPGIITFLVQAGRKYFANVFGTGGGENNAGVYGVEVTTAPIPGAIWLLGSGIAGLGYLKRRKLFSA